MKSVKFSLGVAAVAGLLWGGAVKAGSLDPTNAPGPTMHTLEEIYQQLLAVQQQALANQQALAEMQQRLVADGNMQPISGEMVLIPSGSFVMGACTNVGHESNPEELPQHTVSVSSFYLDKYEVTKAKWDVVYAWATNHGYGFDNPGTGKAADHPVQMVNWYDCLKWCNARSVMDGFQPCYTNLGGTVYTNGTLGNGGCNWSAGGYRLPTEAEWEKAARGGVASRRFPWNDANTIQHARANYLANPAGYVYDTNPTNGNHATYKTGGTPYTSPPGSFAPNGYGLHDMAGNVWEWCWDWYGATYYGSSSGADPKGPASGSMRTMRSGSWTSFAEEERCGNRNYDSPAFEASSVGFRCARGL